MNNEKVNLKEKTVCIYDHGLFLEFGITISKYFKKVYYFTPWVSPFPKNSGVLIGEGLEDEGLYRINNFWDYVDEVDLFIFPDCYNADIENHLESIGKRVWGSRSGDELELLRMEAKNHFKQLGIPVQPVREIQGLDKLRNYLKKNDNKYIKISTYRGCFETFHAPNYLLSEPILDDLETTLGASQSLVKFVVEDAIDGDDVVETGWDGVCIDGKYWQKSLFGYEQKDEGYFACVKELKDMSPIITDYLDKISDTLRKYKYRNFMSTEIRVGSDKVPYMTDACFSQDTEVLTDAGWKLFSKCTVEDKFATLNTDTSNIEYQHAVDYIEYDYSGKMIEMSNGKKTIEALITPNHSVLRTDRNKKKLFKERADSLTDKGFIPRTGIWNGGEDDEYFILPEYHNEWDWNRTSSKGNEYTVCTKIKHEEAKKIPLKKWAAFMAWFLAEGSTSQGYVVNIAQCTKINEAKKVIEDIGFKCHYSGHGFQISSTQLSLYLQKYGICNEKYIPRYILDASKEVIREFLDNYYLADGSYHKGNKVYRTTSKQLIDGLQECLFKVGSVGNILKDNAKGTPIYGFEKNGDKVYYRNHDCYSIIERNNFTDYWFETQKRKDRYINEVDYTGKVYCVTVPNGTLYARRKGKPFWSSNCQRFGSPPSELFQTMIDNLGDILWYGAEGVLIEPEFNCKYGVEVLIHSDWANNHWQAVHVKPEVRKWTKFRNLTKIDETYYIVPQQGELPEIGAIVATGESIEDCIKKIKKYVQGVTGYRLDIKVGAIENMSEVMKKGEKLGIKF